MATTLNVSLFLPYTIAFHDHPANDDEPSHSPPTAAARQSRRASAIELGQKRGSQVSLLAGPTTPQTPAAALTDDFFASKFGPESQKLLFARPGDPRSVVHSDAHVPDWGEQAVFNQPRSRAGPLPSNSILDFAKAQDELIEQKRRQQQRRKQLSSPPSRSSRNQSRAQSHDRGYEGKPWTVEPAIHQNGGLTNAIRSASNEEGVGTTWIGTVGFPTDSLSQNLKEDIDDKLLNEHESVVVYVSDKNLDGHYKHFCKTILWPIFHYQVPDHPKSKAYADNSWEFYRNVNQAFADKIVAHYKRGDTIWIHDYHLLLVPGMVRKKLPEAPIGFFLHSAFPSSEIFRCLAKRNELLEGMLGANLVVFQTEEYSAHFLNTCGRILTLETTGDGVQLEDHFVNVLNYPIGIDPPAIQKCREEEEVAEWVQALQEKYKGKHVIVARDKLDAVHGVRQKLLSYELFLNKFPEWAGKTVLIQVALSTSEGSELLTTVSDIETRIGSVHSTLAHQPLQFLKQDITYSGYLALLTIADVLMISSLRDGMNLTPHEFILCQDGKATPKKHGPVILSEFTGSAVVLGKNIISINPWDYQQQAQAIKQALEMSEAEKARRWNGLHNVVMSRTGGSWALKLVESLAKIHEQHHDHATTSVPRLSITRLCAKYKESARRIFIIDYEGTLAPHRTSSGIPLSSPQRVLESLSELMADSKNVVYVMSGRRPEEIEDIFRTLPMLGLIAENGCFVREFRSTANEWQAFVDQSEAEKWKSEVRNILKYYIERTDGSSLEERHCSLLFRYDKSPDQEAAMRQAGESADQINTSCKQMNIHAVPINKAVLVEQFDTSKGQAATYIFNKLRQQAISRGEQAADFMMVAGDDREDEGIFQWANDLGKEQVLRHVFTVSVGKRNTCAQATLTQGSTGLLTALQKLARISQEDAPPDYLNRKEGA